MRLGSPCLWLHRPNVGGGGGGSAEHVGRGPASSRVAQPNIPEFSLPFASIHSATILLQATIILCLNYCNCLSSASLIPEIFTEHRLGLGTVLGSGDQW